MAQYQQQTQDPNRYHTALQTLMHAERDVSQLLEELHNAIRRHTEKGKAPIDTQVPDNGTSAGNKEKERENSSHEEETTTAGEEHITRRRTLQQRLRETRLVLHRVKFLQGDVYHVLDSQHPSEESYRVADEIRRELLKGSLPPSDNRRSQPTDIDIEQVQKRRPFT